jgi:hypothetical protein
MSPAIGKSKGTHRHDKLKFVGQLIPLYFKNLKT